MIKLIASDIDGTLVNDKKELPPDFAEIIEGLEKRGVTFAVASGRSYAALKVQFAEFGDRLAYICDNGAYIVYKGVLVSRSIMHRDTVREVLELCGECGLIPLICAEHGPYYSTEDVPFITEVLKYYNNCVRAKDLRGCGDDVFKIAVYGANDLEHRGYPELMERFGGRLSVGLSGLHWVDIMNGGVNKGRGINVLQAALGIGCDETMAFGDYLNDLEMLRCATMSFAMKSCHPLIAKAARFRTGSNNDFAVAKEIKKRVLGK